MGHWELSPPGKEGIDALEKVEQGSGQSVNGKTKF